MRPPPLLLSIFSIFFFFFTPSHALATPWPRPGHALATPRLPRPGHAPGRGRGVAMYRWADGPCSNNTVSLQLVR